MLEPVPLLTAGVGRGGGALEKSSNEDSIEIGLDVIELEARDMAPLVRPELFVFT